MFSKEMRFLLDERNILETLLAKIVFYDSLPRKTEEDRKTTTSASIVNWIAGLQKNMNNCFNNKTFNAAFITIFIAVLVRKFTLLGQSAIHHPPSTIRHPPCFCPIINKNNIGYIFVKQGLKKSNIFVLLSITQLKWKFRQSKFHNIYLHSDKIKKRLRKIEGFSL